MIFKLQKKHIGRLQFTLLNITNNLVPLFANILISFLTVRIAGVELWGSYSKILLLVMLTAQILAWGNKEFLLREFSLHPAQIETNWKKTFSSRNLLLLLILFLFFLIPNAREWLLTCLILLSKYIYHSYEVIILYQRRFLVRILSEIIGIIILCLGILLYRQDITLQQLLFITFITEAIKALIAILYFGRNFFPAFTIIPSLEILKRSSLFFMLAFSGMLLSRVDQVIVAGALPPKSFGFYQVYLSFLLLTQSFSNFIFQPVLKTFYRCSISTHTKISRSLFMFGVIFCLGSIVLIKFILQFFYGLRVDTTMLIAGWIFTLAPYAYLPYGYYLYRINKHHYTLVANIVGVILTLALIAFLQGKIENLMLAILCISAMIQWLITGTYILLFKKSLSAK